MDTKERAIVERFLTKFPAMFFMDIAEIVEETISKMRKTGSHGKGYLLAAALGMIGGGAIVAIATKAIPKMMSAMMHNMVAKMSEGGCNPAEI